MNHNWEIKKLEEVCKIKPPKNEAREKLNGSDIVSFVPMEDLDINQKYFNPIKEKTLQEVIRSYTYFSNDDVLLAKITPCFENGKLGIAKNLKNGIGFGSSEFIVFRTNKEILPEFLYYFLSQDLFRFEGFKRMTGAVGHKRVPPDFIKYYKIPVPPLLEQKRIVSILDETFTSIAKAKENAEKNFTNAKELFESYLNNVFANPGDDWEKKKLGDICDFVRGPFGGSLKKQIFVKNGYAVYEQAHAIYNQFNDIRYFINEEKFKEMKRFEINPGNLIMSCSGTMGKISIVPTEVKKGIINQALLLLKTNKKINNIFLKFWMESESFQESLKTFSLGAAIQNVASVKTLKEIKINLPALSEQKSIVIKLNKFFTETKQLEEIYKQKITNIYELKHSILNKAFNGEI